MKIDLSEMDRYDAMRELVAITQPEVDPIEGLVHTAEWGREARQDGDPEIVIIRGRDRETLTEVFARVGL
jgi:hypothetical protein